MNEQPNFDADAPVISDITRVLHAMAAGDQRAAQELLPLVYQELRHLAGRKMSREQPGHTLNATALVHEAYLRLVEPVAGADSRWDGKAHFFAAAAEAMRRILVENARRKLRVKHGGEVSKVELDDVAAPQRREELIELDEALEKFAAEEPEAAEVVKLRFFVGMSVEEAADALGISRATANRHWAYARAWLQSAMSK